MIYFLLRALLRHALRVFFRRIEVEGLEEVPPSGPLLLAANHPNTLIDVLLVALFLERRVQFVAKATLFRNPLAGAVFRTLGAIPVHRRQDLPVNVDAEAEARANAEAGADAEARARNAEALAACEQVVAGGGAVLIFPEGVSQDEPRLMELKTGLARIALGAEARAPGEVVIVPAALTYDDAKTFRSQARIRYAAPIRVAPYAAQPHAPPGPDSEVGDAEAGEGASAASEPGPAPNGPSAEAVRALTEAVRVSLVDAMVHVEDPAHDPLVADLDRLYGEEPERVERVRALLADYQAGLAAAGVDDAAVRERARHGPRGELLLLALAAPLAVWGILNHLLLYHTPRVILRWVPVHPLYNATVKLTTGLLALFLCYALQGWGAWELAQWAGGEAALGISPGPLVAIYLGTLPLCGLVALMWIERLEARARSMRARRRRLTPKTLLDLRRRRGALMAALETAKADYLTRVADTSRAVEGPLDDGLGW